MEEQVISTDENLGGMKITMKNGLTLIGRSRAADTTAFFIPELKLYLDAGCIVTSMKPLDVLITHMHADHCFRLTHLVSRQKPPNFHLPRQMMLNVERFLWASQELSGASTEFCEMKNLEDGPAWVQKNHEIFGHECGEEFVISRKGNKYVVECFKMCHYVPTLGYGVSSIKTKLKEEYKGLHGKEIARMKREGVVVTEEIRVPLFVFNGDTTTECFELEENKNIFNYPVIITECSFIQEEEREKSVSSQHTLWQDLKKVVEDHRDIQFVVIHVSNRYSVKEAEKPFLDQPNVTVMLQRESSGMVFGGTIGAFHKN